MSVKKYINYLRWRIDDKLWKSISRMLLYLYGDIDKKIIVDKRLQILDIIKSPGPNPTGLTWDGKFLYHCDAFTSMLYVMDANGNIVETYKLPLTHPWGLTHDGKYFWISDDFTHEVHQIKVDKNSQTVKIIRTFNFPRTDIHGLTWDSRHLIAVERLRGKLLYIDIKSGKIKKTYSIPTFEGGGVDYNGHLCLVSDSTGGLVKTFVYLINLDGQILDKFSLMKVHPHDIAFVDDNTLYLSLIHI